MKRIITKYYENDKLVKREIVEEEQPILKNPFSQEIPRETPTGLTPLFPRDKTWCINPTFTVGGMVHNYEYPDWMPRFG